MEKLILACGRYIPPSSENLEFRVRAVEAYLTRLTEELELLVGEMDRALDALETLLTERDGVWAAAAVSDGEGGM